MISYEHFFIIIIISILGPIVSLLSLIFFQLREAELNLLEIQNNRVLLEKELETSKYYQLSQEIQPHFLFNALNSLLSLLRLKKYGELTEGFEHVVLFLRYKYKVDANLYPLHEEIKYTNHYLEIQKIRFGHRLTISFTVNEEVVDELTIPFLLQTLVENAFKHGIEEIEEPSLLIITVEREQDRVVIKVIDDGPGFTSEGDIKLGTGLKNVTDRLNLIYGDQAELILKNNVGRNGASVTVSWPIGFKKVE